MSYSNEDLVNKLYKKGDLLSLEAAQEIKRLESTVEWLVKTIEKLEEENKNG